MSQQNEEDDESRNGQSCHDRRKVFIVLLVVTSVSQRHFIRQRDSCHFFLYHTRQGSHVHVTAHIGHDRNGIDTVPAYQLSVFYGRYHFCHLPQGNLRTAQYRNQFVFQIGETGTIGSLTFQCHGDVIISFPHTSHLYTVAIAHGQRAFQLHILYAQTRSLIFFQHHLGRSLRFTEVGLCQPYFRHLTQHAQVFPGHGFQ